MEKKIYYKVFYCDFGENDYEYVCFAVKLTPEEKDFFKKALKENYYNEASGVREAVEWALEDLYEKYHIQGTLENPIEEAIEI